MIEEKLKKHIASALLELGVENVAIILERPADLGHGDFSTNVAMAGAKKSGKNPRELALDIVAKLELLNDPDILLIEMAGPGFINFKLSKKYFTDALLEAQQQGEKFGTSNALGGKKVIIEYTDPNPFKEFHIGHLLPNTVGESLSRIIEASGAEVKRVNYQGDVGLHVAKAVWSLLNTIVIDENDFIVRLIEKLGNGIQADGAALMQIVAMAIVATVEDDGKHLAAAFKAWSRRLRPRP